MSHRCDTGVEANQPSTPRYHRDRVRPGRAGELRGELQTDRIELGELVILGAKVKLQSLSAELLIDNSAWARLDQPRLPQQRAEEISTWIEQGRIAVCLPFLLEAGYCARDAPEHRELVDELLSLPFIPIDRDVERRALAAQQQLARVGHHRLAPVDLLLTAIADIHGVGILHYDGDYDLIREKTDLTFDSVWLAARGEL